jgi:hypothetical protein
MNPVKFTGLGNVTSHQAGGMTLLYAEPREAQIIQQTVEQDFDRLFPDIYYRISATEEDGELQVENIYYFFNSISGFNDPMDTQPSVWPTLKVVVPEDSEGVIYFKVTLYPVFTPTCVFLETPPADSTYVYYKALANVSRGDGTTTTFVQRHFGLITIPSQMLFSPLL